MAKILLLSHGENEAKKKLWVPEDPRKQVLLCYHKKETLVIGD